MIHFLKYQNKTGYKNKPVHVLCSQIEHMFFSESPVNLCFCLDSSIHDDTLASPTDCAILFKNVNAVALYTVVSCFRQNCAALYI